ncbi:putative DNA-binding transcriptional regulator YafY, contains an HTH and WYL domains [Nocardia amikacinitolerans]|uniref:helix-turn-helix transcriptional regulator n=1 Tax=Nocardia amikacinitolerans TaxID=756689 RepID=UPI00082E2B52|nr:WYL domain-containing protein [Nocardia amikacinitolerans]MCP2318924.1 putative DNA-binding transcriptional regulator YafY, contains an HTH and WYL domains [Nocardia amikacinitolerans]
MSHDLPARILRLLSLLQMRREWSGADLADRLGVTVRTVRRDIDRLRELGYPVDSGPGHHGGYRLTSGTDLPPLLLDDDEAVAIAVALRTAATGLTGIAETALRALAKLEQVLPARLRGRVTAVEQTVTALHYTGDGPQADPAVLATVAAACRDHEILTFDYITGPRRVEPLALVTGARRWYLVAFDTYRDDWRLYRLDRLTAPRPTGRRVTPRPLPARDPAAFVADKIAEAPARYRAVAIVAASAESVAARSWGALPNRIKPLDGDTCTLDLSGDSLPRIAALLTGLDIDYTLDADPAVFDHLAKVADRMHRAERPST